MREKEQGRTKEKGWKKGRKKKRNETDVCVL